MPTNPRLNEIIRKADRALVNARKAHQAAVQAEEAIATLVAEQPDNGYLADLHSRILRDVDEYGTEIDYQTGIRSAARFEAGLAR